MSIQLAITEQLNNIFKNTKASLTQPLVANPISKVDPFLGYLTGEEEKPLNQIEQYSKSLWVYICVRKKAQSLARVPLKVFKRKSQRGTKGLTKNQIKEISKSCSTILPSTSEYFVSGKSLSKISIDILLKTEAIEEANGSDLEILLNKPNQYSTKYWLFEGATTYLELRGDSFIEMVGEKEEPISETNPPVELWHINPDNMHIVPDTKDFIKTYVFELNGQWMQIPKENIMHTKYFNPLSPYYGQSTIEALNHTIRQDSNANEYQANFFKNGMRPSGTLGTKEVLGEMQFERLKKEFETKYMGLRGMHKPLILESGLEWNSMTMSQRDADFIESLKMNTENFISALGLYPVIVGRGVANRSVAEVQRHLFYQDTLRPIGGQFEEKINHEIAPLFGIEFFVKFDWSDTPAGQVDKEEMIKAINLGMSSGLISLNEGRANLVRLGIEYDEGNVNIGDVGDTLYTQANMIPVATTKGEDLTENEDEMGEEENGEE